jgi:hypothetical protein
MAGLKFKRNQIAQQSNPPMPKYYVDTTSPSPANIAFVLRKHPCGGKDTMIAKCLFVEHAQLVCNALNAYVEPRKSNVKIVNRRHRCSKNELIAK